jgi:hypothetical protein
MAFMSYGQLMHRESENLLIFIAYGKSQSAIFQTTYIAHRSLLLPCSYKLVRPTAC